MSVAAAAPPRWRWRKRSARQAMSSASTSPAPMLARARQIAPAGCAVDFVLADATVYPFEPASFDLLASRFGVMFFAEPALSFANLHRAMRPSGRLAFACWREPRENPFFMVPLQAVYKHVPKLPQLGPEDPGPFSFASEARVHRILGEAGFPGSRWSRAICRSISRSGAASRRRSQSALEIGPAAARLPSNRRRCAPPRRIRSAKRWRRMPRDSRAAAGLDLDRAPREPRERLRPALPRSSRDGRWSARPFPCPAR